VKVEIPPQLPNPPNAADLQVGQYVEILGVKEDYANFSGSFQMRGRVTGVSVSSPGYLYIHIALRSEGTARISFCTMSVLKNKLYTCKSSEYLIRNTDRLFRVLEGEEEQQLAADWKSYRLTQNLPYYSGTLGADPEIFFEKKNGQVIPAWEFLPEKPAPVKLTPEQPEAVFEHYWDGFQGEFTIQNGTCAAYFTDRIHRALKDLIGRLQTYDPTAVLSQKSVIEVSANDLETLPDPYVTLGCKPSLNAYGVTGGDMKDPRSLPFRFAGGHIHLGNVDYRKRAPQIVKAIDAMLGVASVGIFAEMDDPRRRRWYGLAGEYRLPDHGVEYRVLSNAWLCAPPIALLCLDMIRQAAAIGFGGETDWYFQTSDEEVQSLINNYDVKGAREYVRRHERVYRRFAELKYGTQNDPATTLFKAIYEGAGAVVDTSAMKKNWLLGAGECWVTHVGSPGVSFNSLSANLKAERERLVVEQSGIFHSKFTYTSVATV